MSVTVGAVDFGASSIRVCRVDHRRRPAGARGRPSHRARARCTTATTCDGTGPRLVAEMPSADSSSRRDRRPARVDRRRHVGRRLRAARPSRRARRAADLVPRRPHRRLPRPCSSGSAHGTSSRRPDCRPCRSTRSSSSRRTTASNSRARTHLLMLPELLVHHLTGRDHRRAVVGGNDRPARSSATRTWSAELADAIGVDRSLLPPLQPAGTQVGSWRGDPGAPGRRPRHRVGRARRGASTTPRSSPPARGCSSGASRTTPDTSDAAFAAGLSNELGALGGVRLLRNVAGWWLVEECRRQWGDPDLDELLARAASIAPCPIVDALDPRLLAPVRHGHDPR